MNLQQRRLNSGLAGILSGFLISLSLAQTLPTSAQSLSQPSQPSQFDQLPVLVEPASPRWLTSARQTYAISIQIPAEAGAALAALQVQQPDPEQALDFDLDQTAAFQGKTGRSSSISLQSVEQIQPSQIQINFAQPIQPGTVVTILLKPRHVPTGRNYYPLVISALPAGAGASSRELGQQQIATCRSRYDGASDGRVLFWDLPPEFNPYLRDRPCQR